MFLTDTPYFSVHLFYVSFLTGMKHFTAFLLFECWIKKTAQQRRHFEIHQDFS